MKSYFKVRVINPKRIYHLMEGDVVKVEWEEVGDMLKPKGFLVNIKGYDNLRKIGYTDKQIKERNLEEKGFTVLVDAWDVEKL